MAKFKLYDNDKLTVIDAAMQIGFPNDGLFPRRGEALEFTINGEKRLVRGAIGEPAVITINGEEANINSKIAKNDNIVIEESTYGKPASQNIEGLPEYKQTMRFIVNGQAIDCPRFVEVNGELKSGDYNICQGDKIEILNYYTLGQVLKFMDIDFNKKRVKVNNKISNEDEKVYENFSIDFEDDEYEPEYREDEEDYEEDYKDNQIVEILENDFEYNKTVNENTTANMIITVNGTVVVLKNKKQYIFVDILDFYHFDTSVAGGKELVTTINGIKCDFTSKLKDGDVIEIYWRN